MPSARNAGMGGLHLTYTDGSGALINNPAGLVGKKEFGLLEVSANIVSPKNDPKELLAVIDVMPTAFSSGDPAEMATALDSIVDEKGRLNIGANLGGPLSLSIVGSGFGFGLFTGANTNIAFNGGKATILADVNAQANLAYGHRIIESDRHTLDIGFGVNAFYRVGAKAEAKVEEISSIMDDPMAKLPLNATFGIGLDVGLQYGFNERFGIAIAANNLFSYAKIMDFRDDISDMTGTGFFDGKTPNDDKNGSSYRSLNAGMHFQLIKSWLLNFTLMADYRDILDLFSEIPRNPVLNVGLGAELGLLDDFITVRAGVSDALPSFGVGVNLLLFKLNAAVYGKELGLDPGVQPVLCADIGLLFRW
jgi:hypothetical protein